MRKIKFIIILAVISYLIWRFLLKKPDEADPVMEAAVQLKNDPQAYAQSQIDAFKNLVKERLGVPAEEDPGIVPPTITDPYATDYAVPVDQTSTLDQETIDDVKAALQQVEQISKVIETNYEPEQPLLITDQAVPEPVVKDPYREFVSVSTPLPYVAPKPVLTSPISTTIKPVRLTFQPEYMIMR